jgi:hypothetical protein
MKRTLVADCIEHLVSSGRAARQAARRWWCFVGGKTARVACVSSAIVRRPALSDENRCLRSTQPEKPMSADKDRGIRRVKQKRAKENKRQARQQREAAAAGSPAPSTSKQRAA